MPAKSAAQQKAAGAALAAKRGEISPSKLKGASRSMYKSMSEKQLDEFASTKRKGRQAGAHFEVAHEEAVVALNGAEIASAQEHGAQDHRPQDIVAAQVVSLSRLL
jgi:hypothetical protein